MLKPEILTDEKLSLMSLLARFLFVALILSADDAGRLIDNVKHIDGGVFGSSDESARDALEELATAGLIRRGVAENGQRVIQITNWARHQKIDHPGYASCLPCIAGDPDDAAMRFWRSKRTAKAQKSDSATVSNSQDEALATSPPESRETIAETLATSSRDSRETLGSPTSSSSSSSSSSRVNDQDLVAVAATSSTEVDTTRLGGWPLAAAANAGIERRWGKQKQQLKANAMMFEELQAEKVDIAFGMRCVYEYALTAELTEPPKSMRFFRAHIMDRWRIVSKIGSFSVSKAKSPADQPPTAFEAESIQHARDGSTLFQQFCDQLNLEWKPAEDEAA